jgi:hypothetical protein
MSATLKVPTLASSSTQPVALSCSSLLPTQVNEGTPTVVVQAVGSNTPPDPSSSSAKPTTVAAAVNTAGNNTAVPEDVGNKTLAAPVPSTSSSSKPSAASTSSSAKPPAVPKRSQLKPSTSSSGKRPKKTTLKRKSTAPPVPLSKPVELEAPRSPQKSKSTKSKLTPKFSPVKKMQASIQVTVQLLGKAISRKTAQGKDWKETYVMCIDEDKQTQRIAKLQQWGNGVSNIDMAKMLMGKVYSLAGPKIEDNSSYSLSGVQVQILRNTKVVESSNDELPVVATLQPHLTTINCLKECFNRQHVVVPGIVFRVKPTANGKMLKGVCSIYDAGSLLTVKVFAEAWVEVQHLLPGVGVLVFGAVEKVNQSLTMDAKFTSVSLVASAVTVQGSSGVRLFDAPLKQPMHIIRTFPNVSNNEESFIEVLQTPPREMMWFQERKVRVTGVGGEYITFTCFCGSLLDDIGDVWTCQEHGGQDDENIVLKCTPMLQVKVMTSTQTFTFSNVTVKAGFEQLLFGMTCQELVETDEMPPVNEGPFYCTFGVDCKKKVITLLEEVPIIQL